jgi:hypothetical protein
MEKGFDNGGVKWKLSSVSLGRFKSSGWKGPLGRQILGRWSHQMSFSSSKEEKRKGTYLTWIFHRGKGFGIKAFQRIVRAQKMIQNLPWKQC